MGACLSFCHAATAPCRVPWPRRKRRARKRKALAEAAASAVAASVGELRLGFARDFGDRYELGREIGHGQSARVHAARDRRTGAAIAIKIVPKALLVAPDAAEDIRREVSILRALAGRPHVVTLLDALEDDDVVYLVMELCRGGELFSRIIAAGHFSERRAAVIMRAVLTLVAECHLAGVIHRDIKAENFMFRTHDDASLVAIDFGSAAYFMSGQVFSEVVGNLYYVAPEVLRRQYGTPADIWSCGVLMYVLLSGTLPFVARTEAGTYAAILHATIDFTSAPSWPSVSDGAKDLLRGLLRRDPGARLTAAQALSHAWLKGSTSAAGAATRGAPAVPLDEAALAALGRFAAQSALRRAALRAVAAAVPRGELPDVADQYAALDADHDGRVTRAEVAAALGSLSNAARRAQHHHGDDDEGHGMEEESDSDSETGGSSSDEGAAAGKLLSDEEVEEALHVLDPDGDGVVAFADFAAATMRPSHIWPAAEAARTPQQAAATRARWRSRARVAFDRLDRNRDGFIDAADLGIELGDADAAAAELEAATAPSAPSRLSFRDFCALLRGEGPAQPPAASPEQPPEQPRPDAVVEGAAASGMQAGEGRTGEDAQDAQAKQLQAAAAR